MQPLSSPRIALPRHLFIARLVYFFFYAAWAALLPFLPIFYRAEGLSGAQIGVITSILPLMTLVAAPLWGGLADATQKHRNILLGVMLGSLASVAALMQMHVFALLILFAALYAFFHAPVIPLIDTSVLALLKGERAEYGRQRLWGAVGWGLSAPLAGWLAGYLGDPARFYAYLVLMLVCILAAARLPVAKTSLGGGFWKNVGLLLQDRRWAFFLLAVFIGGLSAGMVNNFLFLFLSDLKASQTVMGLALTMATISEVPGLFYSGKLVQRLGPRGVMVMALGVYVFRLLAYSVVSAPWQVLLIQLTHGLTFAALWGAGVSYAGQLAPKGLEATAQGLFNATLMGFGSFSGALLGGLLFDRLGGSGMYRIGGLIALAGLGLFVLTSLAGRRARAGAQES
jgi:PPP family 3-phenylpropionic acid transporter